MKKEVREFIEQEIENKKLFIQNLMNTAHGGTFLHLFNIIGCELSIEIDFTDMSYDEMYSKIIECKRLVLEKFKK